MYLIVASTPYAGWRRLLPALTQGGCEAVDDATVDEWRAAVTASSTKQNGTTRKAYQALLDVCNNPALLPLGEGITAEQLATWVTEFDDTLLLLLHTRPEGAVIKALAENQDPVVALQAWQTAAMQLLEANRHHRQRTRMIDVDCAVKNAAEFRKVCQQHLDLDGRKISTTGVSLEEDEADVNDELRHVIAAQTVAQSGGAQDLISELEASSLPVGVPQWPLSVDCHEAFEELQQNQGAQSVEQENELLLLQLHQVQEELESYYLELQNEITKRQQIEKELEKTRQQTQEQLEAMRASLSWKVTAPLRAVSKPLFNRRQNAENA